eukprot:TRINITY_DN2730_c0_g1_i4.p2 TRINITY_DN2730_c0_g1~~TRINITY_DN2730_c0_g1_i4.p2  ORF type:complete len:251 (+),score=86.46 TRINITY_DN2730_c0_g1_i4:1316-2068(+)
MSSLDPKTCVVLETIGEGGEAVVRRGRHGDEEVAMKFTSKECREIEVLQDITHSNVLRMVGWFQSGREVCVVTEMCDACVYDLYEQGAVHVDDTKILAHQLLLGLAYIHSRGLLHNDIKPENLLLKGGVLKIADFNLATYLTSSDPIETKGTVNYMSPERINHTPVTCTSDIWSFGCTLYYLLERALLFEAPNEFFTMKAVVGYKEPSPSPIPIAGCLGASADRPSAEACLGHQWLVGVHPYGPFKTLKI